MKKNILLLFGGKSCEHDISIISTFQCLKYFDEYLYDLTLVYINKNGEWKLVDNFSSINKFLASRDKLRNVQLGVNDNILYVKKGKKYKPLININVVFPIMHGINGEDGCVMGLLKMSEVPFVGCDIISSVVGIDKSVFKKVIGNKNVLPMKELTLDELNDIDLSKIKKEIKFPCIIKPSKLGSSIGIEKCENEGNFIELAKKTLKFDEKIIVEPFISELREFNVALYKAGGEYVVSEIEEPILHDEILSFRDKYLNFSDQYVSKNIPAKIGKCIRDKIVILAKKCYSTLNCRGVVRVDFIYDKIEKKLYINEINTIPGALALYLFEAKGMNRGEVINSLIEESLRQFNCEENLVTRYDSLIFEQGNISKFK